MFEPFFTTREVGHGTGLGLSTVHGIVRQAGGQVRIESAPGRGTTVRVHLPLVENAPEPARADVAGAPGGVGETILVVEDEDAVRRLAARMLAGSGYRVLQAANAAEALRKCEEHEGRIDLLLSDVVMPGMSGPAMAEVVRSRWPEVALLFMSGYARGVLSERGAVEGPHLPKPYTRNTLVRAVRRALDQRKRPE